MASAQDVETSVANNSPSQDSSGPDDFSQSRHVTPGFIQAFLFCFQLIMPSWKLDDFLFNFQQILLAEISLLPKDQILDQLEDRLL